MLPAGQPFLAMKYTALATWRLTQGIYRVDPTLFDALVSTPLDHDIPVDILLRLPEWSLYIELAKGVETLRGIANGAWIWMEPSADGGILLYILFDTERELSASLDDDVMFPLYLKLTKGSLAESLEQTYPAGSGELHQRLRAAAEPVLSVLLYLCSQNTDLTRQGRPAAPQRPVPVKTRRQGAKMFPAKSLTQWDVGVRMGAALRNAQESTHRDTEGQSANRHPVGHIGVVTT